MKQKPRIRISSKAYQRVSPDSRDPQLCRDSPPSSPTYSPPRASFNVRQRIRSVTRRRERTKAVILTLILHLIGLFWLVHQIKPTERIDDAIAVDFVEPPREKRTPIKTKPREIKPTAQATVNEFKRADTTVKVHTDAARFKAPEAADVELKAGDALPGDTLTTDVKLNHTGEILAGTTSGSQNIASGRGEGRSGGGTSRRGSGFDAFREGKGSRTRKDEPSAPDADLTTKVDENQLGAVLEGTAQEPSGHIRIIRLKHSISDWWQDPTAIPSFAKWLQEHTKLRADMTYAGGALPLTDERILNAPIIIMTGHDKDITVGRNLNKEGGPLAEGFTSHERAQLRKYIIERKGMLFYDDCGFNGNFAAIVQNEIQRTFPEYPLNNIDHTHSLYTFYYQLPRPPRGGDVFWNNLNKGDSGGYFTTESQFKYQKGITINRRLAVVYNRKDYMCAMETAEVGSRALLRMRRSNDVHRFMTNLLIYQMTYGGNTDRANFKK